MRNETSYLKAGPSKELLAKDAQSITLWPEELEGANECEANEHEEELVNNEILDSFVPKEERSSGSIRGYMTCSEVGKVIEDKFQAAVEVATRGIVTGIVEKTIEHGFIVGFDDQKPEIKRTFTNMVE